MECAVCWRIKPKKISNEITNNIEDLIREHVFEGFSSAIKAYPSIICSSCKANLFAAARGQSRSSWLEEVKKVKTTFKEMRTFD